MQTAYLKYLKTEFSASEKMYEESLNILKHTSPCNQPVVLVKRMQLYGKLNKMDSVNAIYKKSLSIAGQCSILKYKIYATEELLTDRQKELLALLAKGLSNKEIAEKLFISENTVKYHIKNIYLALGLKDRKELFLKIVSKNK